MLIILSIPAGAVIALAARRGGASFLIWITNGRRKRRIEAGYQKVYEDKGNWTGGAIGKGRLIGTNRSISAPLLSEWLGREATLSEMQNLSIALAHKIYYKEFWLPIQGDKIKSQLMANFIADIRSSAGRKGIQQLKHALNTLGENLPINGTVTDNTLAAINRQILKSERRFNNTFHDQMVKYYTSISGGSNAKFLKNWLSSLNRDYPKI